VAWYRCSGRGEVVGGVFFIVDKLSGVEELAVRAGADLVDHGGLQIQHHAARDVLACPRLAEEGFGVSEGAGRRDGAGAGRTTGDAEHVGVRAEEGDRGGIPRVDHQEHCGDCASLFQ
jgi:hypothetical protein